MGAFVGWLSGWLVGWLVGVLVGWPAGWPAFREYKQRLLNSKCPDLWAEPAHVRLGSENRRPPMNRRGPGLRP